MASKRRPAPASFLIKLRELLLAEDPQIISWDSLGRITISDPGKLSAEVLINYFRHNNFSSFQRQLNYFGYYKISGKGKLERCVYTNNALRHEGDGAPGVEAPPYEIDALLRLKRKSSREGPAAAAEASEDVGAVVWAAGIAARPVVARLCEKLGQATARGLEVDDRLRVKAAKGDAFGTVFALGDCALSGYAPTAQVAGQQGKYLGRAIRDGAAGADDALMAPFAYAHAGSLCCLGSGHAIAQLAAPRAPAFYAWRGLHAAGKDGDERAVVGGPAFVLWRSLYFSQLLSAKTCFSVSSDWLKTLTSGRDAGAVEPIQRRATDAGLS
mmetsp:Transcript_2784/g.9455  ORF Transcript_2784/g.9455 Transcript_2784/m.9455 type:complete len:327 (-) Transcript_2784:44-1024(-)